MSRKGKMPILLPQGVEVKIEGSKVHVKGPKGTLVQAIETGVKVEKQDQHIQVSLEPKFEEKKALHGLYRSILANMVQGVKEGFEKKLEMIGVGYRAALQGDKLNLSIGLSHPTLMQIPQGITVAVEKNTLITVSGFDKQRVGQFAADIRAKKPPEPYKGKGIRYVGEYVRQKAGKTAKK